MAQCERRFKPMNRTKIDWATHTWNPVIGCLNSCPYCYARSTAKRWGLSFEPHWREKNFNRVMPKEPARIFVNSMSDIAFWRPEWWHKVLGRIDNNPQHTFLFLTKKPEVYFNVLAIPRNCWLGVTITGPSDLDQYADTLFDVSLRKTFISYEPMLQPLDPRLVEDRTSWVILAAESGNRPEKVVPPPDWIEPWLHLKIPLYMKHNLPWSGPWRKEFPA
jgi:protein gp37